MKLRDLINEGLKGSKYRVVKLNPSINQYYNFRLRVGVDHLLSHLVLHSQDFFFIQIGANDGIRDDRLHSFIKKHHLKGIVVEPLKDMFESLTKAYKDESNVRPINAAIHEVAKELTMYRVNPQALEVPDWSHGIASLDKDHLLNKAKKVPAIAKNILEEKVRAMTLQELIDENKVTHVDLLQIDTEGYDYEIIKMIQFNKFKPKMIRYENVHLSKANSLACLKLLTDQGYSLFDEKDDVIAYLEDFQ